jgi:hypothetical protein
MNRKTIGILSSFILILNYIWVATISNLFPENISLYELDSTLGRLIFTAGMIGFYYALILSLRPYNFRTEVNLLKGCILLVLLSFTLGLVWFYNGLNSPYILPTVYIAALIVFIIFGFKILRHSNDEYSNLPGLKAFIISMFIIIGLVMIKSAILSVFQRWEYQGLVNLIYIIPYVYGILFFKNEIDPEMKGNSNVMQD